MEVTTFKMIRFLTLIVLLFSFDACLPPNVLVPQNQTREYSVDKNPNWINTINQMDGHIEKQAKFLDVWKATSLMVGDIGISVIEKRINYKRKLALITGKTEHHQRIEIMMGALSFEKTLVGVNALKKVIDSTGKDRGFSKDTAFATLILNEIDNKIEKLLSVGTIDLDNRGPFHISKNEHYGVISDLAYVLRDPRKSSPMIASLPKGSYVIVMGEKGSWMHVRTYSEGWINKALLAYPISDRIFKKNLSFQERYSKEVEEEPLPIKSKKRNRKTKVTKKKKKSVKSAKKHQQKTEKGKIVPPEGKVQSQEKKCESEKNVQHELVVYRDCEIRKGPGPLYPSIKRVRANTKIRETGVRIGDWIEVEIDGEKGYIFKDFVGE